LSNGCVDTKVIFFRKRVCALQLSAIIKASPT
jgi:hypothetical protein